MKPCVYRSIIQTLEHEYIINLINAKGTSKGGQNECSKSMGRKSNYTNI